MSSGSSIGGVIGANKMSKLSALGKEAYTDVQFNLINLDCFVTLAKTEYKNLNLKGPPEGGGFAPKGR